MIDWVKEYITSVTGVAILSLIVDCVLPEGNIRKYARFACALILSICIISPIFDLKPDTAFSLEKNEQVYIDYTQAIEKTVQGIYGFENASVRVTQNGGKVQEIFITLSDSKLLEKAQQTAMKEYLCNTLSAIYGIEKENIWIDTEGLTRTDYKDSRGGELGYITDSKWRNGNYTNNLFYKTGHNKPERINSRIIKKLSDIDAKEDYKFGLMSDIILNGVSQKAAEIAAGIKDTIFLPDYYYINDMEKAASTLSLSKIKSVKAMQEAYMKKYMAEKDQLDARLEKTPFNKGITSQQEFDALPDNDPVKVTFEKAAIKLSTSYLSYWQQMGKINSFEELQKIRQQQKADARANFNYAFAKDPQILLAYALNRNKNNVIEILNKTLKNNNIKYRSLHKRQTCRF